LVSERCPCDRIVHVQPQAGHVVRQAILGRAAIHRDKFVLPGLARQAGVCMALRGIEENRSDRAQLFPRLAEPPRCFSLATLNAPSEAHQFVTNSVTRTRLMRGQPSIDPRSAEEPALRPST
jgi:hypothetical protein